MVKTFEQKVIDAFNNDFMNGQFVNIVMPDSKGYERRKYQVKIGDKYLPKLVYDIKMYSNIAQWFDSKLTLVDVDKSDVDSDMVNTLMGIKDFASVSYDYKNATDLKVLKKLEDGMKLDMSGDLGNSKSKTDLCKALEAAYKVVADKKKMNSQSFEDMKTLTMLRKSDVNRRKELIEKAYTYYKNEYKVSTLDERNGAIREALVELKNELQTSMVITLLKKYEGDQFPELNDLLENVKKYIKVDIELEMKILNYSKPDVVNSDTCSDFRSYLKSVERKDGEDAKFNNGDFKEIIPNVYYLSNSETGVSGVYLRNVYVMKSEILEVLKERPIKVSAPKTLIKDKIRKGFKTSRYRTFTLDNVESITIAGQTITR